MLNNYQIITYSTIDEKAPSVYIMTFYEVYTCTCIIKSAEYFSPY